MFPWFSMVFWVFFTLLPPSVSTKNQLGCQSIVVLPLSIVFCGFLQFFRSWNPQKLHSPITDALIQSQCAALLSIVLTCCSTAAVWLMTDIWVALQAASGTGASLLEVQIQHHGTHQNTRVRISLWGPLYWQLKKLHCRTRTQNKIWWHGPGLLHTESQSAQCWEISILTPPMWLSNENLSKPNTGSTTRSKRSLAHMKDSSIWQDSRVRLLSPNRVSIVLNNDLRVRPSPQFMYRFISQPMWVSLTIQSVTMCCGGHRQPTSASSSHCSPNWCLNWCMKHDMIPGCPGGPLWPTRLSPIEISPLTSLLKNTKKLSWVVELGGWTKPTLIHIDHSYIKCEWKGMWMGWEAVVRIPNLISTVKGYTLLCGSSKAITVLLNQCFTDNSILPSKSFLNKPLSKMVSFK